jgi:hypothetical protein
MAPPLLMSVDETMAAGNEPLPTPQRLHDQLKNHTVQKVDIVQNLHNAGWCHGDRRPSNFVIKSVTPHIIDFLTLYRLDSMDPNVVQGFEDPYWPDQFDAERYPGIFLVLHIHVSFDSNYGAFPCTIVGYTGQVPSAAHQVLSPTLSSIFWLLYPLHAIFPLTYTPLHLLHPPRYITPSIHH